MKRRESVYVVDRIEGDRVVLVPDDGSVAGPNPEQALPRAQLPPVSEGDVLRVKAKRDGSPDWGSATVDSSLREERLREAEARLVRLRRRDPGGDITL